jgi:hypothetical protein
VSSARHEWIRPYPLHEKAALSVEILSAYVSVRRRIRGTELQRLVEDLRGPAPAESVYSDSAAGKAAAIRIGRAIGRTLRLVPGDSRCLARSLVLIALLARRGVPTKLVIGVSPGPDFRAHAWVESDGLALLPSLEHIHTRIVEL